MVVDSSALIAVLFAEPDYMPFATALTSSADKFISAATLVETALVVESRRRERGRAELDATIIECQLAIVPVDIAQAEAARAAWRLYGKGRHQAALNFGDCFSYALAKVMNDTLLFRGRDFALTDIASHL